MASFAFARSGAARVYAVEPDDSPLVGRQAIRRITDGLPVEVIGGVGEALPLPDASVDIAYCRATLHHVEDLGGFATECARVLRPGGVFLACREPVVRDARELHRFLGDHRVHQLAGGEHAYYLDEYVGALTGAGLAMQRVFGPWDTIINAFPAFDSDEALRDVVGAKLRKKLGPLGGLAAPLRILDPLFLLWIRRPRPGRSFSFFARKP
jgi:SAM-dependent methyltransferase